uniref:RNase H type-1 domain-containing protein n=1 Tax=Cannabis sativa TaxID=3483 RepID=A0A803NPW8_CANSA
MVCWWLWHDRNSVLFGKKQLRLEVIGDLARVSLEEFQGAGTVGVGQELWPSYCCYWCVYWCTGCDCCYWCSFCAVGAAAANGACGWFKRWQPPVDGNFVLSIHASVTPSRGFVGFGGVIRGEEGFVWAVWAIGGVGEFQVVVAKLLVLQLGLIWASRLGPNVMRVEIDSSIVSSLVKYADSNFMFKSIIDGIISLIAAVGGDSCYAISYFANGVAHALAKSITIV